MALKSVFSEAWPWNGLDAMGHLGRAMTATEWPQYLGRDSSLKHNSVDQSLQRYSDHLLTLNPKP